MITSAGVGYGGIDLCRSIIYTKEKYKMFGVCPVFRILTVKR